MKGAVWYPLSPRDSPTYVGEEHVGHQEGTTMMNEDGTAGRC